MEWKGVRLGGHNIGVIFFDLDYQFNVLRFVGNKTLNLCKQSFHVCVTNSDLVITEILEQQIIDTLKMSEKTVSSSTFQDMDDVITDSLGRLQVLRCSSLSCVMATMPRVEKLLSLNRRTALIVVDSINAFYTSADVGENRRLFNNFVTFLRRLCDVYKVTIFAAKSALFVKDMYYEDAKTGTTMLKHNEYLGKFWSDSVHYRLILRSQTRASSRIFFLCKELGFENRQVLPFGIVKGGIEFL